MGREPSEAWTNFLHHRPRAAVTVPPTPKGGMHSYEGSSYGRSHRPHRVLVGGGGAYAAITDHERADQEQHDHRAPTSRTSRSRAPTCPRRPSGRSRASRARPAPPALPARPSRARRPPAARARRQATGRCRQGRRHGASVFGRGGYGDCRHRCENPTGSDTGPADRHVPGGRVVDQRRVLPGRGAGGEVYSAFVDHVRPGVHRRGTQSLDRRASGRTSKTSLYVFVELRARPGGSGLRRGARGAARERKGFEGAHRRGARKR